MIRLTKSLPDVILGRIDNQLLAFWIDQVLDADEVWMGEVEAFGGQLILFFPPFEMYTIERHDLCPDSRCFPQRKDTEPRRQLSNFIIDAGRCGSDCCNSFMLPLMGRRQRLVGTLRIDEREVAYG